MCETHKYTLLNMRKARSQSYDTAQGPPSVPLFGLVLKMYYRGVGLISYKQLHSYIRL
jgi:hypothetical protein